MVGPPGCGKTHLARQARAATPLSPDEALTITRIHSVAGQLATTAYAAAAPVPGTAPQQLCGGPAGGRKQPKTGELSLAHGGVLFLDELAEFPRAVLDQLRQPLEEGTVRLSRARLKTAFPAAITLVAATNPCSCGWHGDREHGCRCSQSQRQRYWQRLSGPLLDRLDLQLRLERRPAEEMRRCLRGDHTSHETWLQPQTIAAARQRMHDRNPGGVCNRELPATALGDRGGFAPAALQLWERLVAHRGYSTRSGIRLLRVARTVADLNGEARVSADAVAEASHYRCSDVMGSREPCRLTNP